MLFILSVVLIVFGSGSFRRLLRCDGRIQAVRLWDAGQMLTIGIMSIITCGIALVLEGIFG